MDLHEARAIAERMLDEVVRPGNDDEIVIIDESTRESADCWIFVYQSRAWLETRSFQHMLVGNSPILVDKATGRTSFGRTDISAEEQLDRPQTPWRKVREHQDPVALGVHPARKALDARYTGMPAYLRRDAHDAVAAAVARPGLVVVLGPALAGKTRLAYEVMREALPDRLLIAPPDPAAVRKLCTEARGIAGAVIWLDGATRLMMCGALDEAVRAFRGRDVVLLATLTGTGDELDRLPGTDNPFPEATVVRLPRRLTNPERLRVDNDDGVDPRVRLAAWAYLSGVGFGGYLAGGPEVARRWQRALDGEQVTAGAVIAAAVAARQHDFLAPIPRALLAKLWPHFLPGGGGESPGDFAAALDWAVRPARPAARGCLVPLPDDCYQPFSYLSYEGDDKLPVPVWQALLDHADDEDARLVGLGAARHLPAVEENALRRAASAGDRFAMTDLGNLLAGARRNDEAEQWYRRAIEHGDLMAATELGRLVSLRKAGAPDPGFDRDDVRVMYALGSGLEEHETVDHIGSLLRAAARGDPEKLYQVGGALRDLGEGYQEETKTWLRKAAGQGHLDAMRHLGEVHEADGQTEQAEQWYRQAAEGGHGRAMYRLGCLYEKLGDRTAAARWHREGIKAGEQKSLGRLGQLMVQAGHPEKAEQLYQAALRARHPDAQKLLDGLRAD